MPNNSVISEGNTTNEAIANGLKILNVSQDMVNVKVLETEKKSFFSILAPRVVKVELTLKEEKNTTIQSSKDFNKEVVKPKELKKYSQEELETAENNLSNFLNEFLPKIGENISFKIEKDEYGLNVSINGENASFLIGYRGDTLYALQNIVSVIASKNQNSRVRIILDIEGYKEKRKKTLEDLADKIENTVFRTKRSVTLEPMKSYERKIIHSKLQTSKKVITHSIGEEPRRRVVISVK
jgi:spoIIIJ-associated protein